MIVTINDFMDYRRSHAVRRCASIASILSIRTVYVRIHGSRGRAVGYGKLPGRDSIICRAAKRVYSLLTLRTFEL